MSGVGQLLADLHKLGIEVRAENGKLHVSAPLGVITPSLREQLTTNKTRILEFLQLAESINTQQRGIVPLQATGTQPPIFAAAGHNGDVFCYRQLAAALGTDQPFFGLQPPGYDPDTVPLTDVGELAAYFAQQIIATTHRQPCVVAGYCAGGTIAFDLVRKLRSLGQPVLRLVLFGAPICTWYRAGPQAIAVIRHLTNKNLAFMASTLRTGNYRKAQALMIRSFPSFLPQKQPVDETLARRRMVEKSTAKAVTGYQPEPLDVHADIMLPGRYIMQNRAALLGWTKFVSSHACYEGPADSNNDTMLSAAHAPAFARLYVKSGTTGQAIK